MTVVQCLRWTFDYLYLICSQKCDTIHTANTHGLVDVRDLKTIFKISYQCWFCIAELRKHLVLLLVLLNHLKNACTAKCGISLQDP